MPGDTVLDMGTLREENARLNAQIASLWKAKHGASVARFVEAGAIFLILFRKGETNNLYDVRGSGHEMWINGSWQSLQRKP